jgi:hypothetical protein
MNSALRSRFVNIAASQLGVRESYGQNRGEAIEDFQRATWLAPGPWPWCAAFVAWCLREWLELPEVLSELGLPTLQAAEKWRCRDARAYGWEDWARKRGIPLLGEDESVRCGDVVTFDVSHIGIVGSDYSPEMGDVIRTIEGNTCAAGSREGDGVYRKQRPRTFIRRIIRIGG